VQNFPTVGLIDGTFRANLEETGMSYDARGRDGPRAHRLDLVTSPYVFDEQQAEAMTDAGRHRRRAHGPDHPGTIGAQTAHPSTSASPASRPSATPPQPPEADVIVLCHGGPIATAADAQYVLSRTKGVAGFFRRLQRGTSANPRSPSPNQ